MTGDHWSGTARGARAATDPYRTLGVSPTVSDGELRRVYRRLVQLHHPDHNGGSAQSAERFAQIQNAYVTALNTRRAMATPTLSTFEALDIPDTWAPPAFVPDQESPADGFQSSGSADYDRPLAWMMDEPSVEPARAAPDARPVSSPTSPRSAWAEPWLEERIATFERSFAAEREAAERAKLLRRTTESYARALDDAAKLEAADGSAGWDGVERRSSARRLGDWFRGV